jgi:uncharacterized protein (TIGR02466 family)
MEQNSQNLISKHRYILNKPELETLSRGIQKYLDIYSSEIMGIKEKLYITQSWSLINEPGIGMHAHAHSNSLVSGSFYYEEMPEPVSPMVFQRYNNYQPFKFVVVDEKKNEFNTSDAYVSMKKGNLFLFPSDLQHHIEPNQSDKPRYSIAFNCFIRGTLGVYQDANELHLM